MRRMALAFLGVCTVLGLAAGCDRPSGGSFVNLDLGGGRYYLDVPDTGGGSSLRCNSQGEGTKVVSERYDFSWARGARALSIVDGKLSVDGSDRGTLQPGDRITVTPAGDVLVNGKKR